MWRSLGISVALLIPAAALLPWFTSDFGQDYAAARGWWMGQDTNGSTVELLRICAPDLAQAYAKTKFGGVMQTPHPPIATMLALPFAAVPWPMARALWLLTSWTAVAVAWSYGKANLWTCLATIPLWTMALGLGTHEPILFLLLTCAFRYENEQPARAGVLLGLAAAIKIYPAFLLLGLVVGRRRTMLLSAAATLLMACAFAELVIGLGSSWKWLEYIPVNTARYVDTERNLSLVRQVRLLCPCLTPFVISCGLSVVLALPLVRHLYRGASSRHLVSAMLLASPLTWRYYLTLLSVQPLRVHELVGLGLPAMILILGMLGIMPSEQIPRLVQTGLIFLCELPFLVTLLSVWYRAVVMKSASNRTGHATQFD
jgi:alpha-1,2-mannosyltransferase